MRPGPHAALLAAAILVPAVAACGGGDDQEAARPATTAEYLATVEALLMPPGRLASAVSVTLDGEGGASRSELDGLVSAAEHELDELRSLRLTSAELRAQRARLVRAYRPLIASMRPLADALADGDPARVRTAARPFFRETRALPSAISSSSS